MRFEASIVKLTRFAAVDHHVSVLTHGYDHWRIGDERPLPNDVYGNYWFEPHHGDDPISCLAFTNYGLNNSQSGLVTAIRHTMPRARWDLFCNEYDGEYVLNDGGEVVIADNGTERFNDLVCGDGWANTQVLVFTYSGTEYASRYIAMILEHGASVFFDLGLSTIDLWKREDASRHISDDCCELAYIVENEGVVLPDEFGEEECFEKVAGSIVDSGVDAMPSLYSDEATVGTDGVGPAMFYFYFLYLPHDAALSIFHRMIEKKQQMAIEAFGFYASMPGFTLPIMREWQAGLTDRSPKLMGLLRDSIQKAERIAETFMGKEIKPGIGPQSLVL